MLLTPMHDPARPARLAVVAYDVACPRRQRRVRRLLQELDTGCQYSVFELLLPHAQVRGVMAELSALCCLGEDRLALWWPLGGARLHWAEGRLRGRQRHAGSDRALPPHDVTAGSANTIVCYDIADPERLRAVAQAIAPQAAMVQRSVYWLRMPAASMWAALQHCARRLDEGDRLWAYPLHGAEALWRVGESGSALLPMAAHRWTKGDGS